MPILVVILFVTCSFSAYPAPTQNKNVVDSLKYVLSVVRDAAKVDALNKLCWEYRTFDHNRAIEYGLQALGLAEQLKYKAGMARAFNILGLVYRRHGNYPQALDYHFKSLKVSEESRDSSLIAPALNNIGLLYMGQSNYALALEYFERTLKTYEALHDQSGIAAAMENIGAIYSRQGKHSTGLEYLMKSLAIIEQGGDPEATADVFAEIATLYSRQGNYTLALQGFLKALAINERIGNKSAVAQILSSVAMVYYKTNAYKRAEQSALKAMTLAKETGEIEWMKQASQTLSLIYTAENEYQKALQYQTMFSTMKDSITGEESIRKIADLETMLASEKRQAQIDLLTKEKQLQVLIIIALGTGLVLVFALVSVFFRSNRRQKKANKLLSQQNTEILRQQTLLEEQAREIEITNTGLQEMNFDLHHQQKLLEEQAHEIELANNELLELNVNLEHQQHQLEEQSRQIEMANYELQERNVQLHELNDQKNEFLAIAAHDLKNPLASIIMSAGTIKRYYDKLTSEDILESITRIETTAGRMRQIILNLLDLNALESGKFEVSPEPVSPADVVEKLMDDWTARASDKAITIHFDNQAPDQIINADPQLLHQVLDNLLSNAVKYSPQGKHVWLRLKKFTTHEEQPLPEIPSGVRPSMRLQTYLRLEVQDEGPGLSAEDKGKLFGKFSRLSARPTGGEHSTGLGLSIVKKMVEAMNGKVWCESESGNGAMFIMELPITEPY